MEDVLIVGGGPAGLMAADYLSKLNLKITIVDQMPTMGRKFLMAGKSGLAISPIWEKLSEKIAKLNCITIAALNGTVAGGAFGMILACDIRICVPTARFFYPVMKMGFLPQPSDPNRLIRLIGPSRAKLMLVAGEKIDAHTAYRFGLVDEIVEDEELIDRAHTLLSASLSANQNHVSSIKKLLS